MKIENARQQENNLKAVAFHGHKCLGEYFAKWRTYAKLMIAKRQLRDLQTQKEKSKAKVQTFLKNILEKYVMYVSKFLSSNRL